MIELDTAQLSPRLVTILMLRGSQLPPLEWCENPSRQAKQMLEELSDNGKLLGGEGVEDEAMAAAVRALLYLWSGWPGDCEMYAELAPQCEQSYLLALCRRQAGRPAEAKEFCARVDVHPIYKRLADYALKTIGPAPAPSLKRLRSVIEFGQQWEPFAFIDTYELARDNQLDPAGEGIVRSLQCREMELFFQHCFEAATGRKMDAPRQPAPTPKRRREDTRPRHAPAASHAGPPAEPARGAAGGKPNSDRKSPALAPAALAGQVGVQCPECHKTNFVAESARGKAVSCTTCGTRYRVPERKTAVATR